MDAEGRMMVARRDDKDGDDDLASGSSKMRRMADDADFCEELSDIIDRQSARLYDNLDEYQGDTLAERVLALSDFKLSESAVDLGKHMMLNDYDESMICYAVNTFDSLKLSKHGTKRALNLLKRWAYVNRHVPEKYPDVCSGLVSDKKRRLASLFDSVEGLVSSKESYTISLKFIKSQLSAPVYMFEEDLKLFAGASHVFHKLDPELRDFFSGVVDEAIEFNTKAEYSARRRYNNMGNVLLGLESFGKQRKQKVMDLVRKVKAKDKKNILYCFYAPLGELPADTPDIVLDAIGTALGFLQPDSALDESSTRKAYRFVKAVSHAFKHHKPFEMECFFSLYAQELDKLLRSPVSIDDLVPLIEESTRLRRLRDFESAHKELYTSGYTRECSEDDVCQYESENEKKLSLKAGFKYLLLSAEILHRGSNSAEAVNDARYFAQRVAYIRSLGFEEMLEKMVLCKKGVIDDTALIGDEPAGKDDPRSREERKEDEKKLGHLALDDLEEWSRDVKLKRAFNKVISKGPMPCPDHLRKHFLDVFKVEVSEVWDFTGNQRALYCNDDVKDTLEELSRRKHDPEFVKKVVQEMHELNLMEQHLLMMGGGCGLAKTEILFYEELVKRGYDVHLDLIDTSREFLKYAAINSEKKRLRPLITQADLEKLNDDDIDSDRQVLLTLWGGTFFNWKERFDVASKYKDIFLRRDARSPDGTYANPRYFGDKDRRMDLLLIDGDLKKDIKYYRSRASKLFLARGLNKEYDLGMDALTRDGKLCHTLYFDSDRMELQCIYLITKDKGPFKENQAVLVIDSGTMHMDGFEMQMLFKGYDSIFVENEAKTKAVALCQAIDQYKDGDKR